MANQVKTMFGNMSWLMVSTILASVFGFVWTIVLARHLGVTDYGVFGFAISITSLLGVFNDFGVGTQIIRAIACDKNVTDKYLGKAFSLRFVFAVIYYTVIFIVLTILKSSPQTILITLLFALEVVIKSFSSLCNSTFDAHEKNKYHAYAEISLNLCTLVFILVAVFFKLGLLGVAFAYIFANICSLSFNFFNIRRSIIKPKLHFDFKFWKQLLIWGIPFALTSIFYTIYYQIDIVMLTKMVGSYTTGLYNASYKLINVLTSFYGIYSVVIFPVMSKFFHSEKNLLKLSYEKSIKYLLLFSLPAAFGMSFYATDIINFIYGSQYAGADVILQILVWTVVLIFVNGATANLLNASHQEISVTRIYLLAAIFNAVLNLFLIPSCSYVGASSATVLSDCFICIIGLYPLYKINHLPSKHLVFDVGKIIIATVIFAVILIILKLNLFIAIPVGIVIYLILIFVLKILDDADKNIVHQIIGR
ncbi:MAG: flippase [archaeon]|nr:flippase [archaeon]